MSDIRIDLAEAQELNQRIVARQRAAIALLERIRADQLDRDEIVEAGETLLVIETLKGMRS